MQFIRFLSRIVNGLTGGSFDETFCSRAWRADYHEEGRVVRTIDKLMLALFGETHHCRKCALREFKRRGGRG